MNETVYLLGLPHCVSTIHRWKKVWSDVTSTPMRPVYAVKIEPGSSLTCGGRARLGQSLLYSEESNIEHVI